MKKQTGAAKISTIVGKGCVMEGDFLAAGSARIDGTVNGNVTVNGMLVLGVFGKVNGNIKAEAALIAGEVIGNIDAEQKLEASTSAKIFGDIRTNCLVIDETAVFQGKCDMNQEHPTGKKSGVKAGTKAARNGRKSAKAAIAEALKEVAEEDSKLEQDVQTQPDSSAAETAKTEEAVKEKAE